ncbi:ribonuclease E inhibitor RraB [Gracilimonas mengyeensis]|uniref:Regulator of ribonuclease activity B n=1 Tax=Gracilimonas mengyeensis TaxID=1302730 RepID=A0A521BKD6_9BACT|nr:ribonuclease E inhibitor RraB [Gracilimonas mengyeensis]SMO47604.1 Regulator of ribonuclease activity B [Gracilimonas mengyeensis]
MKRSENINQEVVNNITRFGGDLDEERPVDFFLYFPSEYAAVQVEVELINLRFYTEVRYDELTEDWGLFANKKMNVTTERLEDIGNWMEQLANKYGGQYDGWGTVI